MKVDARCPRPSTLPTVCARPLLTFAGGGAGVTGAAVDATTRAADNLASGAAAAYREVCGWCLIGGEVVGVLLVYQDLGRRHLALRRWAIGRVNGLRALQTTWLCGSVP